MQNLKKTGAEIGEMTFQDALDLYAYWRQVPPEPEIMLAAFGGGGGGRRVGGGSSPGGGHKPTEAELRAMADLMNGKR